MKTPKPRILLVSIAMLSVMLVLIYSQVTSPAFAEEQEAPEPQATLLAPDELEWQEYSNNESSIRWSIDEEDTLWIEPLDGTTGILDCSQNETDNTPTQSPWADECESITSVKVPEGCTIECRGSIALLFAGCTNLASVDLSGFDTSQVTDMSSMFQDCTALVSLDVSSFTVNENCAVEFALSGTGLKEVVLGEGFRFTTTPDGETNTIELPTPTGEGYTGRWVLVDVDGTYLDHAYTPDELRDIWEPSLAGMWVWEKTEATDSDIIYNYTEGMDATWNRGQEEGLTFMVERSTEPETTFDHFRTVMVDDVQLAETDFEVTSDSMMVTLDFTYLEELSDGVHELTTVFDDGTAKTNFTVALKDPTIIDIPVTVQWFGPTQDSITFELYADGTYLQSLELVDPEWMGAFTKLPIRNDETSNEIEYTIVGPEIEGYTTEIMGEARSGYTVWITNVETIDLGGTLVWDDADNQDGIRPTAAVVDLLVDGVVRDSHVALAEDDEGDWSWSFNDLPKYDMDGHEIVYLAETRDISGYDATYDGDAIVNTHTPEPKQTEAPTTPEDAEEKDSTPPTSTSAPASDSATDTTGGGATAPKETTEDHKDATAPLPVMSDVTSGGVMLALAVVGIVALAAAAVTKKKVWRDILRRVGAALILLLAIGLLCVQPKAAEAAANNTPEIQMELYNPNGNKSRYVLYKGEGNANKNVSALRNAMEAARKKTNNGDTTVIVKVPAGTYYINDVIGIFSRIHLQLDANTKIVRTSGAAKDKVMLIGVHQHPGITPWVNTTTEDGQKTCEKNCKRDKNGEPTDDSCMRYEKCHDVIITGGTWDGGANFNDGERTCHILSFDHSSGITIEGTTLQNCDGRHVIVFDGVKDATVDRVTIKNHKDDEQLSKNAQLSLDETAEAIHVDSIFEQHVSVGPWPTDPISCQNVTITGCKFYNCLSGVGTHNGDAQITKDGKFDQEKTLFSDVFTVNDCKFLNIKYCCINLVSFRDITIRDNKVTSCSVFVDGVRCCNKEQGNIIANNTVTCNQTNMKHAGDSWCISWRNSSYGTFKENTLILDNGVNRGVSAMCGTETIKTKDNNDLTIKHTYGDIKLQKNKITNAATNGIYVYGNVRAWIFANEITRNNTTPVPKDPKIYGITISNATQRINIGVDCGDKERQVYKDTVKEKVLGNKIENYAVGIVLYNCRISARPVIKYNTISACYRVDEKINEKTKVKTVDRITGKGIKLTEMQQGENTVNNTIVAYNNLSDCSTGLYVATKYKSDAAGKRTTAIIHANKWTQVTQNTVVANQGGQIYNYAAKKWRDIDHKGWYTR